MANMGYCRFVNTTEDMRDCMDGLDDTLSEAEHKARIRFVKQCAEVVFDYAGASDEDEAVAWAKCLVTPVMPR